MCVHKNGPRTVVSDSTSQTVFKHKVMKISKQRSYRDVRQMFVLSSVLYKAIVSVYPRPNVRSDLHGLIGPRIIMTCMPEAVTPSLRQDELFVILWTSTRDNMNPRHWIPRPCVPAVAHIHSNALCVHISVSYRQWLTDSKHGLLRKHH